MTDDETPWTCTFPGCTREAVDRHRCLTHNPDRVRVANTGSWVNDSHPEGGHG